MNKPVHHTDPYDALLDGAERVYDDFAERAELDVGQPSLMSSEMGPRNLRRAGVGTEFFDLRPYRPDTDQEGDIHERYSDRLGYDVVVQHEKEIRHHAYLWCNATADMRFTSDARTLTKLDAARQTAVALSRYLAMKEGMMVGLLGDRHVFSGPRAHTHVATRLLGDVVPSEAMPSDVGRVQPRSTAILFGDFIGAIENDDEFRRKMNDDLDYLAGLHLTGYLVMVHDAAELDFPYEGGTKFSHPEGGLSLAFDEARDLKTEYLRKIEERMTWLESTAETYGFKVILQRTDRPLHEGMMAMYGLLPDHQAAVSAAPAAKPRKWGLK